MFDCWRMKACPHMMCSVRDRLRDWYIIKLKATHNYAIIDTSELANSFEAWSCAAMQHPKREQGAEHPLRV